SSGYLVGKTAERIAVDKAEGEKAYDIQTFKLSNPNVYVVTVEGSKTTITVSSLSTLAASSDNTESNKIIYGGNQARVSDIVVYR
ncbi:MAG: hypothetical protein IJ365_08455, partial [Clostridia bacterium]|nr:hypothetical protein [Clostridia bacterium]